MGQRKLAKFEHGTDAMYAARKMEVRCGDTRVNAHFQITREGDPRVLGIMLTDEETVELRDVLIARTRHPDDPARKPLRSEDDA